MRRSPSRGRPRRRWLHIVLLTPAGLGPRAHRSPTAAGIWRVRFPSRCSRRLYLHADILAANEGRAVAVMACDDEVLPLQSRVETASDEVELDDVYETERQLLYVACTRARERLFVSGVSPGSEFLGDLGEHTGRR